jgi:hypothetical protein
VLWPATLGALSRLLFVDDEIEPANHTVSEAIRLYGSVVNRGPNWSSVPALRGRSLPLGRTLRPDIEEMAATRAFLSLDSVAGEMETGEFLAHLKAPDHDSLRAYHGFLVRWRSKIGQQLLSPAA